MTKEEFIQKAKEVHGNKYNYINLPSNLINSDSIELELGGVVYSQKVGRHLNGRSPEKNINIRTTEEFIEQSKLIHGDKYDYREVEYLGSNIPVIIINDGIRYKQTPRSHLMGNSPDYQLNNDSFIKKAIDVHGDKYDYSLVEYKTNKDKVKIILKKTGEIFEQTPSAHLNYSPEKRTSKSTSDDFVSKAIEIHGSKYTYDKVNYIKAIEKVIITCPIHGDFKQSPNSHLSGAGCKKCMSGSAIREYKKGHTTESFIIEAKKVWGEKYDYSKTVYVNAKTKIIIIHNGIEYTQIPGRHLLYCVEKKK